MKIRRLSLIAIVCMLMTAIAACTSGPTMLKANKVLIDGKESKDVIVVDGKYELRTDGDVDDYSCSRLSTTITFSLINPLTNYTCNPRLELLNGNEVLATMEFGNDSGDTETQKQFRAYCEGHSMREFQAPFFYNSDNAEELKRIVETATSFRIVGMFNK